jgi:predicted MFS family arabinose efflux permease
MWLATAVGLGAALSTSFGGKLIQHYSFRISFLALGGVAAVALALLWFGIPETLRTGPETDTDSPIRPCAQEASA